MRSHFLYLIGQLRPGGSERQLFYLLKTMDRERYRPEVAVWNFQESDTYVNPIRALGVPVHSLPVSASRLEKLIAFRRIVEKIEPQVVHSYSSFTNFAASWGTFRTKSIAIGGVRSDFEWAKEEAGPLLGRLSGRWPRRQVFNSVAAAEAVRRSRSPFRPKRCVVVRNGLDLASFRSVPLAENGKTHILGVGSLFPVKRWDRLIAAAAALKNSGESSFLVRIVGDGPLRKSLEAQVRARGVSELVSFVGHSQDISEMLAGATFLVHPADREGRPNAIMEAMACGRAVIATAVGDVTDLIEDGKTGFAVPCGDDTNLVDRMATLIRNRPLCSQMGGAGRAKAEREFGLARLVSETLDAYRDAGWQEV